MKLFPTLLKIQCGAKVGVQLGKSRYTVVSTQNTKFILILLLIFVVLFFT